MTETVVKFGGVELSKAADNNQTKRNQMNYITSIRRLYFGLTSSFHDFGRITAWYAYATISSVPRISTMVALPSHVTESRFTCKQTGVIKLLRKPQSQAHAENALQGPMYKNIPLKNLKVVVCIDATFATRKEEHFELGAIVVL